MKKLLVILLVLLPNIAFSQINVIHAELDSSALVLQLSKKPIYTATLSDSKKKISVVFNEPVIDSGKIAAISVKGIFNSISLSNDEAQAELILNLNEKSGFTTAYYPYSKTIKIYSFDWATLSAADDHYHTGLLGMDITEAAKESFVYAVDAGNTDAALMMGIILMKEGKVNSAEQYLLFAAREPYPESDVFGALSQVYNMKGNTAYEEKFADKFIEAAHLEKLELIPVAEKIEKGAFYPDSNTITLLDSLRSDSVILEFNESLLQYELTAERYFSGNSKEKIDSAHNERFKDLFQIGETDSTVTDSTFAKLKEALPLWLEIVIWLLFAAAALVIYFYLKWRQDKMKTIKSMQDAAFKKEMKQANEKEQKKSAQVSKKASSAYVQQQRQEQAAEFKKIAERNRNAQQRPTPTARQTGQTGQGVSEQDKQELQRMIAKYRVEHQENTVSTAPAQIPAEKIISHLKTKPELSADVEMALNMAHEQQRMRQEQIKNVKSNDIPENQKELADKAKGMGVEKGSLETKKAIDNLTEDESYYLKLADKFGKKDDKKKNENDREQDK